MELKPLLEALLYAAGRPVALGELLAVFESVVDGPRYTKEEIAAAVEEIRQEYATRAGGVRLEPVAEGWEFRTRPEVAPWIAALSRPRPQRLTASSIETLALVSYRQPVTRADIEAVRGVDSAGVLRTLLERRLVRIVGRKEEPGRPILYGTTGEFLELFGLKDLSELPPLKEFEEMIRSSGTAEEGAEFTVADLTANPAELAVLEQGDRELIEELDEGLKDLKSSEEHAVEAASLPDEPEVTAEEVLDAVGPARSEAKNLSDQNS